MRKMVFIFLLLTMLGVQVVNANVPTVDDIQIKATTDGSIVTVTIQHSGPTSNHYVSEIAIKIGNDETIFELDPQTTVVFTEELSVSATDSVDVRAFCNLHGWSAWVSSGGTDTPVDEPDSVGVPGFPVIAIGLVIILLTQRGRLFN